MVYHKKKFVGKREFAFVQRIRNADSNCSNLVYGEPKDLESSNLELKIKKLKKCL